MSLRFSLVLVIVLSWAAVAVVWAVTDTSVRNAGDRPPFFYTLAVDDIRGISIRTDDGEAAFRLDPEYNYWFFADREGVPVDSFRWGGITTLLGGPRSQRVIEESFSDPARYGLDAPTLSATVELRDGSRVTLHLGQETPNRDGHYARIEGFPQLVLVSSAWGGVLTRLVSDPPLPQWMYDLDVSTVTEATFFIDNVPVRVIDLDRETDTWYVCDLPPGAEVPAGGGIPCDDYRVEADAELVNSHFETFAAPQFVRVQEIGPVDDGVHEQYGVDPDAPYVSIRWETELPTGVREAYNVSIVLGDLTPDGTGMYVLGNEQPDVAVVDADWGRQVREFFDAPVAAGGG